jgi:hypothetical protein
MRPATLLAILGVAALAAFNFYKAATAALTIDEAFTFSQFIVPPMRDMLGHYDANNHVLFTLLAKLSVRLFGTCELAIRLPSVLAGIAYAWGVFRLLSRRIPQPWIVAIAFLSLTLNPLILDFLSAARGYGLALAFLVWAAEYTERSLKGTSPAIAGLLWALMVAANLTFAPVAVAGTLFLLWHHRASWRRLAAVLAPQVAVLAALLLGPLRTAALQDFYVGVESLQGMVAGIIDFSVFSPSFDRESLQTPPVPEWIYADGIQYALIALLGFAIFQFFRLNLPFTLLVISFGMLFLQHALLHRPYFVARSSLSLVFLATWCGYEALSLVWRAHWAARVAVMPGLVLGLLCVIRFASEITPDCYSDWRFDAGNRRLAASLSGLLKAPRNRVANSWLLSESLNYYRERQRLPVSEPFRRDGVDREADFYLLLPEDYAIEQKYGLRRLSVDPISQVMLAEKP